MRDRRMDTKELERNIKTIIKTGAGYGPEFLPVLRNTRKILKKINQGRKIANNYFQLGTLLIDLEDSQLALEAFQAGYNLDENHVNCGVYYALLLEQFGKIDESLAVYLQLHATDPDNIYIVEHMLAIYEVRNNLQAVLRICQYFLSKGLQYPVIHRYIAKAYYNLSDSKRAVTHMETAVAMDTEKSADYINLLVAYYFINHDFKKILYIKDSIFSLEKTTLETKLSYAMSLAEEDKLSEARHIFHSLYIEQKDQSKRLGVLGVLALYHQDFEYDIDKANFINQYILKREPANVHALSNLSLHESDEFALSAYKKVYEKDPEDTTFKYNYGFNLIHLAGDFKRGYELFESRVPLRYKFLSNVLSYPESLENKSIFIWKEQGIGDHICFAWFFQFLSKLNTRVKIQVDNRLLPLMNRAFPSIEFTGKNYDEIIMSENIKDDFDHEIILFSLGKYFIDDIRKRQNEYEKGIFTKSYLMADPEKVKQWILKISKLTSKKTIGICWRSGLTGKGRYSSLSAQMIAEILSDLDCSFVNLQYSYTEKELEILRSALGDRFIHFPEIDLKNDQDELAALIKALDYVFTACTAVYQLSGALGTETYSYVYPRKNDAFSYFGKTYDITSPTAEFWSEKGKFPEDSIAYLKLKLEKAIQL